jgi:putative transposase
LYADVKRALDRLHRELRLMNESAAACLGEGPEETPTLHRLNVFPDLGVSSKTTYLIESVMVRLEAKARRVTRWRTNEQKLRWCGTALWAIERQFRRMKKCRHLPLLQRALQPKLPSTKPAAA